MPVTEIREARREDIVRFRGEDKVGPTVKAIVGLLDGEPVAVAGLTFAKGLVIAFCDLKEPARKYPVLIHKTAKRVMASARAEGRRFIYAEADQNEPRSHRWLTSLGFELVPGHERLYLWRASAA